MEFLPIRSRATPVTPWDIESHVAPIAHVRVAHAHVRVAPTMLISALANRYR